MKTPIVNLGRIDYANPVPPAKYRCSGCDASGCKLWRQHQTFVSHIRLLCCDCAAKGEGKSVDEIDDAGKRPTENGRTDQIGWLVPAVPTVEGDTYWGYSAVPRAGCDWWKKLPTRIQVEPGEDL